MRSKVHCVLGRAGLMRSSATRPAFFMITAQPGSTSRISAASRSNTVQSGARSEAKATTSSFSNQWQGRMPEGSRVTKASPLPSTPTSE